jgi:hypothetical protein
LVILRFGERWKVWTSSLYTFPQPTVTPSEE